MAHLLRFQVGGTLNPQDAVYVKRPEDQDYLAQALRPRSWINIHGCRTMGKSSLYVRHLKTLIEAGITPITIDVAAQVTVHAKTARDWVRSLANAVEFEVLFE